MGPCSLLFYKVLSTCSLCIFLVCFDWSLCSLVAVFLSSRPIFSFAFRDRRVFHRGISCPPLSFFSSFRPLCRRLLLLWLLVLFVRPLLGPFPFPDSLRSLLPPSSSPPPLEVLWLCCVYSSSSLSRFSALLSSSLSLLASFLFTLPLPLALPPAYFSFPVSSRISFPSCVSRVSPSFFVLRLPVSP